MQHRLILGGKSAAYLEIGDLQRLLEEQVPEGLFLEYKSAFPTGLAIPKTVSAFANAEGGWLIIGLDGDASGASRWTPLQRDAGLPDRTKDLVISHVSAVPLFQVRQLDFSTDEVVLVVEVPPSPYTPHVLVQTGSIYIRTPTGSDPIKDRATLDRLTERSLAAKALVERVVETRLRETADLDVGSVLLQILTVPLVGEQDVMNLFESRSRTEKLFEPFPKYMPRGAQQIVSSQHIAYEGDHGRRVSVSTNGLIEFRLPLVGIRAEVIRLSDLRAPPWT